MQAYLSHQKPEVVISLSGLRDFIATEVDLHNPHDLTTAINLARLHEWRMNKSKEEVDLVHKNMKGKN